MTDYPNTVKVERKTVLDGIQYYCHMIPATLTIPGILQLFIKYRVPKQIVKR